ncbi:MAG: PEP-CTERM sorting domain-containing protein, partial [Zoogloea sp.]|nr:PEP-CTERM sorting domain-containing protein [Zoogloea sp.]
QTTTAGCGASIVYDFTPTPPTRVPEPASMALVGLGMMGLAAIRRRK